MGIAHWPSALYLPAPLVKQRVDLVARKSIKIAGGTPATEGQELVAMPWGESSQSPSLCLCPLKHESTVSPCVAVLPRAVVYGTGGCGRWRQTTNGVPCVYSWYEEIRRENLLRLLIVRGDPLNGVLGDHEAISIVSRSTFLCST